MAHDCLDWRSGNLVVIFHKDFSVMLYRPFLFSGHLIQPIQENNKTVLFLLKQTGSFTFNVNELFLVFVVVHSWQKSSIQ